VNVKNGFGRNFLIPQGLAAMATPSAKKVLAENLKQKAHKEKKVVDAANKTADALKTLEVKIPAKTGAGDKLFGSVTTIDLAAALAKDGHEIDKKFISINGGSVKRTGTANAKIRLHRDVVVDFPFEVVAAKK
jgi:large subunit ribosomal protein L9